MKKLLTIACVATICCNAWAQEKMDQDAMMKTWMAYMTPGDIHKELAKDEGKWKQEITMWMTPDAKPEKSSGMVTNKMIMGGRYMESITEGKFNGMPFEGRNTLGYDNAKKVMQSTWIDNMGTGIMYMEGMPDKTGKVVNFRGKMVDPMNGKDMDVREVWTMIDENTHKMEMYMTPAGGKEFKSMEIMEMREK